MRNYRLSVVIEKDADGYFAFCPELQSCYTQGDSYEEAIENIFDLVRQSGSHKIYKNKEGRRVTVPYHSGKILHSTAYTAHSVRPNFGYAETSYMLETLFAIASTYKWSLKRKRDGNPD